MKKSRKLIYTVCALSVCLMILMTIPTLLFNVVAFVLSSCVIFTVFLIIFLIWSNYEKNYCNMVDKVKNYLSENTKEIINFMPVPFVVLSSSNNIVFYNKKFSDEFFNGVAYIDDSIFSYFPDLNIKHLVTIGKEKIYRGDKIFDIYGFNSENFLVIYFMDITERKTLKKLLVENQPCVGFVTFDNKEELKQSMSEEAWPMISITVENMLFQWINGVKGIIKKVSDGKYFVIFEEKYLRKFISEKFKIVDKVHGAKVDSHKYSTISIGIGRGAETLSEAKIWAKSALSMALGRGGDQVAIKNKDSYEFFGGTSQAFEKRSKVRARVMAMALKEKIDLSDKIFVMGHKFSDFDSVGAATGIWDYCSKFKKKSSYVILDKTTSLAGMSIDHLEKNNLSDKIFIAPDEAYSIITEDSLLIIVDTHSTKFLESEDVYNKCKNIVVIDHHRLSVDKITNATIFFHEPFASSACEMVTELLQYMGDKQLKKCEAECLLAGIMLDTKNFSLKTGIRTFEAAAYLKKKGADNTETKKMFASSMETYKLKCHIIESAYVVGDCAIAVLDKTEKNTRIPCSQAADELLDIKNVKASFVLFSDRDKINVSARSLGEVNVQVIMEKLGGGGHQTMAAAQISNMTLDEVKEKLTQIISQITENKN